MSDVRWQDKGWDKLTEMLKEHDGGLTVRVGVIGRDESHEPLVASVHEFGSPVNGIPQRSFIRSTWDAKRDNLRRLADKAVAAAVDGKVELVVGLGRVGEWFASEVRAKIRSNIPPRLKAKTIKRKGSDVALIDTGRLIQSITSTVETGRGAA